MNKRRFVSFAALAALLCVPYTAALSIERTAILANSTILSADQFIDQYCGTMVTTIASDGSNVSQFSWYTQVDAYNAPILVESYTVFGQLSPTVQQTIVAACLAHNLDYFTLIEQAQAFLTPAPIAEVPVETAAQENGTASEQPLSSAPVGEIPQESSLSIQDSTASNQSSATSNVSSQDAGASSTTLTSQEPTTDRIPPAPIASDQDSSKEENQTISLSGQSDSIQTPVQTIIPGQPTTIQNYDSSQVDSQVIFNGTTLAQGLTFEDHTDAFDATTQQIIYALAAKSGLSTFEAHEVIYVYQKDGVRWVSDPLIKLSGGGPVVLFQILNYTDKGANVLFYTDENCSYDAATQKLALAPAGILFVETSSLRTEELGKISEGVPQEIQKQTSSPAQPTSEVVTSEAVQASSSLTNSTSAPASSSSSQATQPDAQATQFLNRYCYQSGLLIRQASQSNYRQLLNAVNDWLNLSANSKTAVNSFLTSMGSQTFQTLYTQANRIRLGLPITQVPAGNQTSASVNTGVWQDPNVWLSGLLLSGQGMIYLSNRRRLGVRFEKKKC